MNFETKIDTLSIVLNDRDQLPASISFHENVKTFYNNKV